MSHEIKGEFLSVSLGTDGDLRMKKRNEGGGIDLDLVTDHAALEQIVRMHLLTRRGEDVISPEVGLPVPEIVGVFNGDFIEGSIRRALYRDYRVKSVSTEVLDYDRVAREVTISVAVKTIEDHDIITDLTLEGA